MPHDLRWDAAGVPNQAPPNRVFIALLVILTLLFSAVGGYVYNRLRYGQRQETERTLTVIAEQKRQQIESWLAQTRDDAQLFFSAQTFLGQRLAAWEAGGRQDVTLLDQARERIAAIQKVRGWSSLAVLDTQGEPIFTLGPANLAPHVQDIQEVLAHPRLLSLDLHPYPQGEYSLLTPITLPDGRLLGLAYLSWLADQTLFPLITAWPVPTQTAETYLVRREGDELLYLSPLRHEPDAALRKRLPLATSNLAGALAVRVQEGILLEARDYRGEPVLAYVTTISGTPWVMISKIDQREAQAGIWQITWITAMILGLILLLTYSLTYAGWRRVQEQGLVMAREANSRLESERRLKLALDAAGHGVWDWHLDTNRVDFSPTWKRMLGYDEVAIDDTVGAWEQLVHPEELTRIWARVQAHLAGETPNFEIIHRLRCQDGTWKWILDRGTVLERDAAGKPLRMLGTHTDIDTQKRAEETLRQTQQRLAEAQAIAHLGSFEYDAATRQTRWSEEEYRIYGLDPAGDSPVYDDLLARCIHPADAGLLHRTFRAALENLSVFELEHRIIRPDGTVRWLYNRARPSLDAQGRLVRYVGVSLDITDRKLAAEAQVASEERLRLFIDRAPAALAMFDGEMRYLAFSRRWLEDYGLSGRDLTGLSHYQVFPEIGEAWKAVHRRALAGETIRADQERFVRANGTALWVRWEVLPWYQSDGTVGGMLIYTENITDRLEAEQALATTNLRLQGLLDALPVGVAFTTGLDIAHVEANATLRRQYDLPPEGELAAAAAEPTAPGRQVRYYHAGRALAAHELPLERAVLEGRPIPPMELEITLPSGRRWIAEVTAVPLRDAKGRLAGGLAVLVDITARKQAEEDLRASEERFRLAMDATSDGIWDWNLPTGAVYYSPGWGRMLGYGPEELAAELGTWAALLHPEERDQILARSRRLLEDPSHYEQEFRLRTKSGDYRWVLSRAKVVEWGSDGAPQRAIGTHVDITERKARELELHR